MGAISEKNLLSTIHPVQLVLRDQISYIDSSAKMGNSFSVNIKFVTWLQRQEPYSLHRPLKRSYQRNIVIVTGIDDQWNVDLMDMAKFAKYNNGHNFILVVIDIFSKYLLLRSLKNKQGESVSKALTEIPSEGRNPKPD